jgi:phosphoribosylaminoimidazole-succinocarboxamide synthase
VVANREHAAGQSTSLRAGIVAASDGDAQVAVVLLADQPDVEPAVVRDVVATVQGDVEAARARYDDAAGHVEIEGLTHLRSGKVRDLYDVDDDHLLLVASDRVSTYDVVHPTPIPDKGRVLTGLSAFWFDRLGRRRAQPPRLDVGPRPPRGRAGPADWLRGRSMLVRKVEIVPFECVVRGYLAGSGWKEYQRTAPSAGCRCRPGSRRPPAARADLHPGDQGRGRRPRRERPVRGDGGRASAPDLAGRLRDLSLRVYAAGAEHAASKGIILADTKFEFGLLDGEVVLADEVLTPDSSRYWPADAWRPAPPRRASTSSSSATTRPRPGGTRQPPAPELPDDVVAATREKYVEAYERLTGEPSTLARHHLTAPRTRHGPPRGHGTGGVPTGPGHGRRGWFAVPPRYRPWEGNHGPPVPPKGGCLVNRRDDGRTDRRHGGTPWPGSASCTSRCTAAPTSSRA